MGHIEPAFFEFRINFFQIFNGKNRTFTNQRDGQDFFVGGLDWKSARCFPEHRHTLFCLFISYCFMLFQLFIRNHSTKAIFKKIQTGFHFQNTFCRFFHTQLAESAIFQRFFQKFKIFDRISKEIGVRTAFDVLPSLIISLDSGADPYHCGCI